MTATIFRETWRSHPQNRELALSVTPDGTPVLSIATITGEYRDETVYGDDGLLIWLQDAAERAEFARQRVAEGVQDAA